MQLPVRLLAAAALALPHSAAAAAAAPALMVDVAVTAGGSSSTPFVHKWKRSFGSGHSSLTVRDDWRAQLKQASHELGLKGVRYH